MFYAIFAFKNDIFKHVCAYTILDIHQENDIFLKKLKKKVHPLSKLDVTLHRQKKIIRISIS